MKVVNYNDDFRKKVYELALKLNKKENYNDEKFVNLFSEFYNNIKKGSPFYDYLLGLVFETAYLVTSFSCTIYQHDDELKNSMSYLKSFSNIDELRDRLTINVFLNFLIDVETFYNSDLHYKKIVVENALKDKGYLINLFPCFLNDVMFYLNKYDASVILDTYYEKVQSKDEDPINNTILENLDDLIVLEEKDFDSYKYVVLEIIEIFYKYKKYLLSKGFLYDNSDKEDETDDGYDIDIISMLENDLLASVYFSIKNESFLKRIISGYIEYKLLPCEKVREIDSFYEDKDNRKDYAKIIKKSYKLKNEKNR